MKGHNILVKANVVCLRWRRYVVMGMLYLHFTASYTMRNLTFYTSRNVVVGWAAFRVIMVTLYCKFENEEVLVLSMVWVSKNVL